MTDRLNAAVHRYHREQAACALDALRIAFGSWQAMRAAAMGAEDGREQERREASRLEKLKSQGHKENIGTAKP